MLNILKKLKILVVAFIVFIILVLVACGMQIISWLIPAMIATGMVWLLFQKPER